jgi:hypothetical protein
MKQIHLRGWGSRRFAALQIFFSTAGSGKEKPHPLSARGNLFFFKSSSKILASTN